MNTLNTPCSVQSRLDPVWRHPHFCIRPKCITCTWFPKLLFQSYYSFLIRFHIPCIFQIYLLASKTNDLHMPLHVNMWTCNTNPIPHSVHSRNISMDFKNVSYSRASSCCYSFLIWIHIGHILIQTQRMFKIYLFWEITSFLCEFLSERSILLQFHIHCILEIYLLHLKMYHVHVHLHLFIAS